MGTSKVSSKGSNHRYYLHRRLRLQGVTVHAQRRTVEIDEELINKLYRKNPIPYQQLYFYLQDLSKNFNYSIQSVIMKANNKDEENGVTKEVALVAEPLVNMTSVEKKFKHLVKRIEPLKEYALDIIIDSGESLTVAENNSAEINSILKAIDKLRVEFKGPYFETVKVIDAFAKTLSGPLTKAKGDVNSSIANWKTVQEAASRATAEKIRKDAEKLADEKAGEADRITRIESQLIARLYGGHWFNSKNERKSSAGCLTTDQCDDLLTIIKDKIPPVEEYEHMIDEYRSMKKNILGLLSKHKSSVIELESDSKVIKENAEKKIDEAKESAGIAVNEKKDEMTQGIIKEAKSEIKSAESEVKDAGKGVRRTLKFAIADIDDIPSEWLLLDEMKVREWVTENKDELKEMMKGGKNVTKGVKFWLDDNYVSR